MTDTGGVTVTAAPPTKRKRGREGAGVVMVLVGMLWFFAQPPASDSKRVRPVDPTEQVTDFQRASPGVPVPGAAPAGFVSNVSVLSAGVLRVGYVIGKDHYAEYSAGRGASFVADQTLKASPVGTVDVDGTAWQHVRSGDGHESLLRTVGDVTVVLGGLRENASLAQLTALAASLR